MKSPLQKKWPPRQRKSAGAAIAGARRGKRPAPEIYVKIRGTKRVPYFAKAHIRNHRGCLELCWREGDKVRTFHLAKGRKSPPTAAASSRTPCSSPAPAAAPTCVGGKNGRRAR